MKKLIQMAMLLALPFSIFSQIPTPKGVGEKLPKMHIETGILKETYGLGDKTVTKPEVRLHLEKNSAQAYHFFQQAQNRSIASYALLPVIVGTTLVTVKSQNNGVKLLAATGTLVACGFGLYCTISAPLKLLKARDTYNKQAGY